MPDVEAPAGTSDALLEKEEDRMMSMVTTMMTNDAKASMANLLRVVLGVVEDAHRAGVVEHLLARREEHVRLDVLRALKRRDSFEKNVLRKMASRQTKC